MKEEINDSNKVVHLNFYKYGALAACLVIFIGVLSLNTQKNITMDEAPSINETANDSFQSPTDLNAGGNPFNSAFFDSATSNSSATTVTTSRNTFLDNIAEFFIGIAQWFTELLF